LINESSASLTALSFGKAFASSGSKTTTVVASVELAKVRALILLPELID